MRKGSDLIGKPVVAFDTGEKIEKIEDLIFDQNSHQLLGFLVDEGGWAQNARVLPLRGVQSIGPDAVLIPSRTMVVDAIQVPAMNAILKHNNVVRGTKLMTTDGRDLGTMSDLYFDEQTGAIEGYEVSGGIFADAYTGRSYVPAPETLKIGNEVAFVPPEVAISMEEQVGGIKAAVQDASAKVQDAAHTTTEAQPAYVPTIEDTRGRRVRQVVQTPQGIVIAAPGQIVTERVIERARMYDKEAELIAATGLAPSQSTHDSAQAAGSQLKHGAAEVKEGISNLWDKLKSKVNDLQEQSAQQIEQQRIEHALGRPTTRVILDQQDAVILNVGEIITHKAIDHARQAGVLNVLLSSVYDQVPALAPDDLRAPEPGQDSLDSREAGQ